MQRKSEPPTSEKVRLDKWLWAARFFKTRSLAKQAIDGGKVHYNAQRVKSGKHIELGATLTVRSGWDDKTITVTGISDKRRSASEAAALYNETNESIEKRAANAAQRKALSASAASMDSKPNKKQRRQIHRFKQQTDT
jgi:ribosome-associated heat shock protein Hsp15